MTRRSDTRALLAEDPDLLDQVLARFVEPEEGLSDRLPRPAQVVQGMGLSWGAFWAYVNDPEHPARLEKFAATMQLRSVLMAEEAIALADDVEESKNAVAKAALQTRNRWRYAESWDKSRFGSGADGGGRAGITVVVQRGGQAAVLTAAPGASTVRIQPQINAPEPALLEEL